MASDDLAPPAGAAPTASPILMTPDKARFKPLGLFKKHRFGVVSLVQDGPGEKRVARWLRQPSTVTEIAFLEGIDRASRMLRGLSHPSLSRFDRLVEGEGGTWMFFHYVEGSPLLQYLGAELTVPTGWVVWWLDHLLGALQYLHAHAPPVAIGHLDPSDILVDGDRLLVCDLGVFERLCPEVWAAHHSDHPFLNFMAPEQRYSVSARPSADLYSAGAIAFWLMTARAPLSGAAVSASLRSQLVAARPDLPRPLVSLLLQLLAFHPGERPTAAAALEQLAAVRVDLTGQDPPPAPAPGSFKRTASTTIVIPDSEDPQPARPGVAAIPTALDEPAEVADAAAPRPDWQEFMEDLWWQIRRPALGTAVIVVSLMVLLVAVFCTAMGPTAPLPPPILSVRQGSIMRQLGTAGPDRPWDTVTELRAGDVSAAGQDGATLQFDQSTLGLGRRAMVTCAGREGDTLTVGFTSGQLRIQTSAVDSVVVHLAVGQLMVGPTSEVVVELTPPHPLSIACQNGSATVQIGSHSLTVAPGSSLDLNPDGHPVSPPSPRPATH